MTEAPMDEPPARVSVHALVVSVSAAAFAFVGLVFGFLQGGISEKEEMRIFVLGSVLVPLAGVIASWAIVRTKQRWFRSHGLFYPVLAIAQAAFWAVAMNRLRTLSPIVPAEMGDGVDFYPHVFRILVGWLVMNAVLVALLAATRRGRFDSAGWLELALWIDRLLPFVVAAALVPFASKTAIPGNVFVLLVGAGAASFVHQELARFPQHNLARYAFDGLLLAAVAVWLFDPAMDADVFHYDFYLGPVSAVRGGRSMLVDVNCQYGVGVIYFIAAVFDLHLKLIPPSVVGFAVIISALAIVQKWVLYGSLRAITRSPALSALIVLLMVAVTRFMPVNYPCAYPSTGGVRFLPGFLVVACFALRARFPERRAIVFVLEALVVGGASVWSFESFVYVAGAYAASIVYEAFHVASRREMIAFVRARLGPTALAIVAFHVALAVLTRMRAGEWPHWSRYFEYIRLYSTQEFGTLPVETWTPWVPLAGTYVATVIALGYRRLVLRKTDLKGPYAVLFGMSALGIAQLTYYVGRSHVMNQFHIALPAFFIAGYWFIAAAEHTRRASDAARGSFVFVCYGAALYLALCALPDVVHKADHTWLWYLLNNHAWNDRPPSARVTDAETLIKRYAPDRRRVALFTSQDNDVEIFLLLRKTSVWPESYPVQDVLIPDARTRILTTDPGLVAGDVVFVDTGSAAKINPEEIHLAQGIETIDRELFSALAARFRFEVVEARPSGVAALRLLPR